MHQGSCNILLKYIEKDKVIWCPFDEEWSAYYQMFTENGYKVIRSSLAEGQDFFTYEPDEHYDIIISNPPFSKKDKVLKLLLLFYFHLQVVCPCYIPFIINDACILKYIF